MKKRDAQQDVLLSVLAVGLAQGGSEAAISSGQGEMLEGTQPYVSSENLRETTYHSRQGFEPR